MIDAEPSIHRIRHGSLVIGESAVRACLESSLVSSARAALADLVRVGYRRAAEEESTSRVDGPRRRDVRGHIRRAHIEQLCAELSPAACPGLIEVADRCVVGTRFNYQLLRFEGIDITVSRVRGPLHLPRPALFRRTLAARGEMLFPDAEIHSDDRIFALLAHAPSADPAAPSLVDLIVPCRYYRDVVCRVPLLGAETIQTEVPIIGVDDRAVIEIKRPAVRSLQA